MDYRLQAPGGGERTSWLYVKEFENLIRPSATVF
jgi:hypothetical protein